MATVTSWAVRIERVALWCDECQTSARLEVDVYVLRVDGVRYKGTATRCMTCQPFTTNEG